MYICRELTLFSMLQDQKIAIQHFANAFGVTPEQALGEVGMLAYIGSDAYQKAYDRWQKEEAEEKRLYEIEWNLANLEIAKHRNHCRIFLKNKSIEQIELFSEIRLLNPKEKHFIDLYKFFQENKSVVLEKFTLEELFIDFPKIKYWFKKHRYPQMELSPFQRIKKLLKPYISFKP